MNLNNCEKAIKYKCTKNYFVNGIIYARIGDIIWIKGNNAYNVSKGLDFSFDIPEEFIEEFVTLEKDFNYGDPPIIISNKFENILKEMQDIYNRKNSDYGNSFDKSLDKFGLIASVVRLSDKFNRIEKLIKDKEQQVKDESIRDTFLDMANYCAMTVSWIDKQ